MPLQVQGNFMQEQSRKAIKQRLTIAVANGKVSVWCTLNGQLSLDYREYLALVC